MRCHRGAPRDEGEGIKLSRDVHGGINRAQQKGDEQGVGGRGRKRAGGREVLISLDPFVD